MKKITVEIEESVYAALLLIGDQNVDEDFRSYITLDIADRLAEACANAIRKNNSLDFYYRQSLAKN